MKDDEILCLHLYKVKKLHSVLNLIVTFDKTELECDDELDAIDDFSFTKIIWEHKPIICSMIVSIICWSYLVFSFV